MRVELRLNGHIIVKYNNSLLNITSTSTSYIYTIKHSHARLNDLHSSTKLHRENNKMNLYLHTVSSLYSKLVATCHLTCEAQTSSVVQDCGF